MSATPFPAASGGVLTANASLCVTIPGKSVFKVCPCKPVPCKTLCERAVQEKWIV
jgi:hypothetical protein